ncbi:Uncharacterised protein [Yersinia massiliensis]|uniref:hypothetical protein n=1 Tax=Yersinia massiliensis TaxID=419257 RepID=UPI0005EA361A|nr:hypothetical protein [Yersinia massiliensis]CNI75595.1 Uncharacterised protein [Yersinia massiliensis]
MMDITKSREEFEKWAEENGYKMDLIPDSNVYSYSSTHCSWQAWQASRESLVVELPKSGFYLGYESPEYMEKDDVIENLRTAGIRIKGESE